MTQAAKIFLGKTGFWISYSVWRTAVYFFLESAAYSRRSLMKILYCALFQEMSSWDLQYACYMVMPHARELSTTLCTSHPSSVHINQVKNEEYSCSAPGQDSASEIGDCLLMGCYQITIHLEN